MHVEIDSQTQQDAETARYYSERASYYERVYQKPERQSDLRKMEAYLTQAFVGRRVLEVACGTGWWTPFGALLSKSWLATDLNNETIEIAKQKKLPQDKVNFKIVDAYSFEQLNDDSFDGAFAGCWWSHIPLQRLQGWLDKLHTRLEPGAKVIVLDNSYVQTSNLPISRKDEDGNTYQIRTLDDGSIYEVVKNFPSSDEARLSLGARAKDVQWIQFHHYWVMEYTVT
jgi:demethylmenaquinone methyltransferase/2-methoxy-6-polyprenyl-1,4-benzoquinol methylase